uniref:Semaphorin-2A n=1 Tax=Ceratitis capitata TaxID=7213 RepID=W8ANI8_CERCA
MLYEPQIKRKMSISRCCHNASGSWGGGGFTVAAATQVFLVLTLFVVGNLSAWQENVRPKLYVELGPEDVLKFLGNESVVDHFKLVTKDSNSLLVGARNIVYNLSIHDLTEQQRLVWQSTEDDVKMCIIKGKAEEACQNYIRIMVVTSPGRLFVCGTNSFRPMCNTYIINDNNYTQEASKSGQAVCPYDPHHNSTSVFADNELYSGTVADFSGSDPIIYREPLQTEQYDSLSLNAPNFVSSFTQGDFVYFFFRETAVEYINCGKAIYSRVARVCKWDKGGPHRFRNRWTSFLKSRLNCSIPGEYPFYFNEIQSVYQLPSDKSRFYATFTTSTNGLIGSAVCSFHINEVQAAFNGKFKEQSSSNSAWLPVLNSRVPEPRPGTCVNDTSNLPDTVLYFIRSHPLMDKAVNHEHNNPVYYKRDLVFTKLVVDKIRIDILNQEYTVYYVGTNLGRIYKIVQYYRNSESLSKLLDIFDVAPNEAIQVMGISQARKSLYVATDHRIKQIDLAMCNRRYDNCFRCVRDPYCGWDKEANTCRPYELDLLQDVANETSDICDSSVLKKKIIVTYGQSVHLGCFVKIPEVLKNEQVTWYHHSKDKGRYEIKYSPTKYIETTERGLVVVSVNEADGGRYDCHLGGSLLCSYNITVDAHRCTPPNKSNDYQKIYSDWCHEFEKYKTAMKSWEKKQAQCSSRQNFSNQHPNDVFRKNNV